MSEILWDVFVSHNRSQKSWVRRVVKQWRDLGLRVFFDEDDIEPGEPIVAGVERGLTGSRHVVLVLSPESLASRWVTQESAITIHSDPDASERSLIPVMVSQIEIDTLRPTIRALRIVDLVDSERRDAEYAQLLKAIGVEAEGPSECPDPMQNADDDQEFLLSLPDPVLEQSAVSAGSLFYVEREADEQVTRQLLGGSATVTLRGYRHSGTSSMLVRLHQWAEQNGFDSFYQNFNGFDESRFENTSQLFRAIADELAYEFELDDELDQDWKDTRGPKPNLTRFVERRILGRGDRPLIIFLDEADIAARKNRDVALELFSQLRNWHGKRATDTKGRWRRLNLVIAHTMDRNLLIEDANQSPFNVGLQIQLSDFNRSEVERLNGLYGRPLKTAAEVDELMALLGGHPALTRRALYSLATTNLTLPELLKTASDQDGLFHEHLEARRRFIQDSPSIRESIRQILKDGTCENEQDFHALWVAGIVAGADLQNVRLRCQLDRRYFKRLLGM